MFCLCPEWAHLVFLYTLAPDYLTHTSSTRSPWNLVSVFQNSNSKGTSTSVSECECQRMPKSCLFSIHRTSERASIPLVIRWLLEWIYIHISMIANVFFICLFAKHTRHKRMKTNCCSPTRPHYVVRVRVQMWLNTPTFFSIARQYLVLGIKCALLFEQPLRTLVLLTDPCKFNPPEAIPPSDRPGHFFLRFLTWSASGHTTVSQTRFFSFF